MKIKSLPASIAPDAFRKIVDTETKLILIDFFAEWCGPCRSISPVVENNICFNFYCDPFVTIMLKNVDAFMLSLAEEFSDALIVYKCDVDKCEDLAKELDIKCMPTFHFYKKGQLVEKFSGANENKLREYVNKHK